VDDPRLRSLGTFNWENRTRRLFESGLSHAKGRLLLLFSFFRSIAKPRAAHRPRLSGWDGCPPVPPGHLPNALMGRERYADDGRKRFGCANAFSSL
jgi:hypothetical protein